MTFSSSALVEPAAEERQVGDRYLRGPQVAEDDGPQGPELPRQRRAARPPLAPGADTAPATATVIEHIALSKLVPSKENVRRTNSQAGILELAASIEAHGLIQNLTVRKGAKGKFEVVAGARRLAALESLEITTLGAIEGRVVSQFPIPGTVLEGGDRTVRLRFEQRRPRLARREEG